MIKQSIAAAMSLGLAAFGGLATGADKPGTYSVRTQAIFVTPPAGWVVSVWQGGTIELAEFTPPGQTGDGYTDLLGYSVVPKVAGVNDTDERFRSFERAKHGCRSTRTLDHAGRDGWFESEYLCVGRDHSPQPNAVEIEFAATKQGTQSVFRVWRSWRGTPAQLTGMIEQREGRKLSPVEVEGNQQTINDADLKTAFVGLEPNFFSDIAKSTICDLSETSACGPLHQPVPAELSSFVPKKPFVGGFIAPGLHELSSEQFRQAFGLSGPGENRANVVIAALLVSDREWNDPQRFNVTVQAIALGRAADGGAMFLSDRNSELEPEGRAVAWSRIIQTSRQLWKVGASPGITMLVAPN